MSSTLDARGMSCPEPVLLTLNKLKELQKGELRVLVDTDTSRENVMRAAQSQGWTVKEVKTAESGYELLLGKQ